MQYPNPFTVVSRPTRFGTLDNERVVRPLTAFSALDRRALRLSGDSTVSDCHLSPNLTRRPDDEFELLLLFSR
jgi:hypothetical protein